MHFYQHHIADFNNATRHLSRIERSIYRDLLDIYYDREKPLPDDIYRVARLALVDNEDFDALQFVLDEFFSLTTDGYRNARADREIEAYQRMSEGGKRGAEKRWGKPKDSPPIAPPCPPQTEGNANHEPITNNHKPVEKELLRSSKKKAASLGADALVSLGVDAGIADDWLAVRAKKRMPLTQAVLNFTQEQAEKAGISLPQAIEYSAKRGWAGFEASYLAGKNTAPAAEKVSW